jgi:hypothetical protein
MEKKEKTMNQPLPEAKPKYPFLPFFFPLPFS